jgi:hypothetical protein
MRRLVRGLMAVAALAAIGPSGAQAQERDHSGGFFLRVSLGGSYAETTVEDDFGDELSFNGPAGDADLAIGVVVAENLAIHGTLFGWSIVDPTVELDGVDEIELEDTTVSLASVGGGVTYYIMPANLYLSGSIGAAWLNAEFEDGDDAETGTGIAFEAMVGKEWWLGDSFGLGVAAAGTYHNVPPTDEDEADGLDKFSGASFGLRVSATFN